MKRNAAFFVLVFFSLFLSLNTVFAQRGSMAQELIDISLASPLPRASDWGRTLDRITAEWVRVTNNQIRVRVLHDGSEGGEGQMFSSLRSNNIQAALFTSIGISEFCPPVMTLSVPFLISNNTELDMVLAEVLPSLDNYVNNTEFVVICWSKGGWVHIFSQEPVFEPDNLRRQKMGSSTELKDINTTFRTMGFNVVEAEMVDIGNRIRSNMINAIYLIPELFAPMGLHKASPLFSTPLVNMLDLPIAPILGAIVMNRVTWNKLSAEQQRNMVTVTKRIAAEFEVTMARTSANTAATFQRDGLKINKPSQTQINMWRAEIDRALPSLLGTAFDRNLYNQINQIIARARNR